MFREQIGDLTIHRAAITLASKRSPVCMRSALDDDDVVTVRPRKKGEGWLPSGPASGTTPGALTKGYLGGSVGGAIGGVVGGIVGGAAGCVAAPFATKGQRRETILSGGAVGAAVGGAGGAAVVGLAAALPGAAVGATIDGGRVVARKVQGKPVFPTIIYLKDDKRKKKQKEEDALAERGEEMGLEPPPVPPGPLPELVELEEQERLAMQQKKTCDRCHRLAEDHASHCAHRGSWHDNFAACSLKCGAKLGVSRLGMCHWSCCYSTEAMSYCPLTNINDHVYTFTSDDLAQVQKAAEEKLVQLVHEWNCQQEARFDYEARVTSLEERHLLEPPPEPQGLGDPKRKRKRLPRGPGPRAIVWRGWL